MEKSRVEKYKQLRDEISQMDTYKFDSPSPYQEAPKENLEDGIQGMSNETLKKEHIKKNTLSISIDQLIKAHDEYTVMISKEELDKQHREDLLEKKRQKRKKILKYLGIAGLFVLAVLIVVLIVVILNN